MEIAPGIRRLGEGLVNVYVLEEAGEITIVDAGAPGYWKDLPGELAIMGRSLDDVRALILTHAHSDHVGFAERIRRERGVPVSVHADDAALARGEVKQVRDEHGPGYQGWSIRAIAGFAVFALTHGMTKVTPIAEVGTFLDGATLDIPGAPRVIHVPGHTAGSVAFHVPSHDAVFVGDAFATRNVITAAAVRTSPPPSTRTTGGRSPPSRAWTAWTHDSSCPATATPGRAGWRRRCGPSARAFRPSCERRPSSLLSRRAAPGARSRRPGRGRRGRASGPRRP